MVHQASALYDLALFRKKKLLISDVAEKRKRDKSFLIKMSTVSSSWLAQLELEHRTLDPGVVSLSFLDIEMT